MKNKLIVSPSAQIIITDNQSFRQLTVKGQAVHLGKMQEFNKNINTSLSTDTLQKIIDTKGDWWLDELERRQEPQYIQKKLITLLERFGGCNNKNILDFGSGSGSSSMVLLDMGAKFVYGIEPDLASVDIAKSRAKDEGRNNKVNFIHLKNTLSLPFSNNKFDLILMNAVLEHINPSIRRQTLTEIYRCLKPGGLLIVAETPNRLFPFDNHTTGLPLIPWLPLSLAYPLAKKFSKHVSTGQSKKYYINQGLIGGSYWQIKNTLPNISCLNMAGGDVDWQCKIKDIPPIIKFSLKIFEQVLNHIFKLPLGTFFPILNLVFIKPAN